MTVLEIETPEGVPLRLDLAGAGSRTAAALIDLALFVLLLLVALLLVALLLTVDAAGISGFLFGLLLGGVMLSFVLFHAVAGTIGMGQTPGKLALGLRVVDAEGNPARPWQLLLRAFFLPLEAFVAFPVSLGILVIVVSRHDQRLGDLVAGTLVVRESRSAAGAEPYPRETWRAYSPKRLDLTPALAARFDNADLALLRELLGRRGLDAPARDALLLEAGRRIASRLEREPPGHVHEARELLHELFLYLRDARRAGRSQASRSGRRSRPR